MELCTIARCIPNHLPNLRPFTPYRTSVQWKFSRPLRPNSIARSNTGSRYYQYSSIKATTSEETSNGANQATTSEETSNGANQATTSEETSNGANQYVKEEPDGVATVDEVQSEEKSGFGGFGLMKDDAVADDQFLQFDFLNKLNIELDFEDSFSTALLGGGGIAALWLTASIVGAIDNIPLFPKLMEVVGLGYTIWFSTRYLLFKKNRDELASKVEEIKQQVLGPKN